VEDRPNGGIGSVHMIGWSFAWWRIISIMTKQTMLCRHDVFLVVARKSTGEYRTINTV